VQAEQAQAEPVAWMNPETLDVIHDTRKRAWESDFGMGGKAKAAGYTCRLVAPALPAQAEQVEAVRAADEQFPIQNTDQARAFLTKWMRANFPTDRTFDRYIAEHLAGDFAWQLANALATKEAAAQVPAAEDVRAKALEDAAFICEAKQSTDTDWDTSFWNQAVQSCAHAIRNLAAPSTTPSNDTSALGDTGGAK
jgi:hypothetical protein